MLCCSSGSADLSLSSSPAVLAGEFKDRQWQQVSKNNIWLCSNDEDLEQLQQ